MEGRWNVLDDQKQGLADRITSTAKAMRISGTEMIKLASKRESGDKNQRDDNLQPSPKSTVLDIIMDVFSTMTSIPPGPWSSDSASPRLKRTTVWYMMVRFLVVSGGCVGSFPCYSCGFQPWYVAQLHYSLHVTHCPLHLVV